MSNIQDLTVGELIPLLRDTYNAIDLRAILLENKKEWECIYFVLRMTIQDKEKLGSLYKRSRSLISGQRSDVQFVYQSRDVSEIESVLDQINNGNVLVGTYNARIEKTKNIFKEKTKTLSGYSISEDSSFPHKVLCYGASDINPLMRLENHGIQPSDLGLTYFPDMKSCFDAGNLYNPYHLILVFPVYAKVLECNPDEVEGTLYSKFEIHNTIFSKCKIRLEIRSPPNELIANPNIEQFNEVLRDRNGMVAYDSTFQDISSLKPGNSGALRIEHDELGAVAVSTFELRTMPDDLRNASMSELATHVPFMTPEDQLINFLRDAGVDYDSPTKQFKIKDDGHTVTFPLTKDNLITEKFDDLFYIRLKNQINIGYKFGLYSSVVVLSRKLVENLLIEVLRKKYPGNEKGNLELYYVTKKGRFHDFTVLLDNLEQKKSTFGIDEPTVSKFISLVKPFRESANSTAHSMIELSNKEEVIKYKIPEMIALLTQLLKHI